ncbi:transporter substrate-binding domain-containing protein [Salicola sp. Rm-C-2C1-2]|uniref:substrate-binding periplasmic protein n=1 Tax=Salicola sp. Rm-C-2C1-2 TaxID=3141321 RepID=UPI0032E3CA89
MRRALLYGLLLMLVSLHGVGQQVGSKPMEPVVFSLAAIEPWAERTPEGERRGLLVDLVEDIRTRIDIPIRYQIRPHSRAILEMENGDADFVPTFVAPGISEIGRPVADLVEVEALVLGRVDDQSIEALSDLNGENVGYLSGTWYGHVFAANEAINKVPVNNVAHGLNLLHRGRLRALVATDVAIPSGVDLSKERSPVRTLLSLETLQGKIYMAHTSSRDKAAQAIAEAMQAMHRDGTLERLFSNRYEAAITP